MHTITDIQAVTGLTTQGAGWLIQVTLSDDRIIWAECVAVDPPFDTLIQQHIQPLVQNQPLNDWVSLSNQIDRLTLPKTTIHPLPPAAAAETEKATLSRRQLLSGLMTADKPQTKRVITAVPLPAALRFGVSQALLKATAVSQNKPLWAVLQKCFDLSRPTQIIPLHLEADEENIAVAAPILTSGVASFGYSTGSTNHKATLGENAEHLQAHVRQVKTWLSTVIPQAAPAIHLNLQGSFTTLYDNNEGKILGALYGLYQTAKPYPLVVENVVKGSAAEVAALYKTLQAYMRIRRMEVTLAAGTDQFSAVDLQHLVTEEALSLVCLNLAQFGSLPEVVRFWQQCQTQNKKVILMAAENNVNTAVALALTTRPQAVAGPPHRLYNEMLKIISTA